MRNNSIDVVAQSRAHERYMQTHSYAFTETEAHYRQKRKRKTICGSEAPREVKPDSMKKYPLCEKCYRLAQPELLQYEAEETRNYWQNPSAGHAPKDNRVIRKVKPKPDYTQPMLPEELLPTGTGLPLPGALIR